MIKKYPWQQPLWQQIQDLIKQGRLPHALLISGNDGAGKLAFARQLAKYLLCDLAEPSHQQKNAALFDSDDGHPDLSLIEPEGKMAIIKIEQIRGLTATLTETAQQGGYRVVIINHAHTMNIAAANALLKTLEEPGEKVCLMLLSSEPYRLLPTIKSRCQQYMLNVDETVGKQWLSQQLPDADIELLWQLSAQSPLKALAMAEGEWLTQRKTLLDGVLNAQDPVAVAGKLYQAADKQSVLNSLTTLVTDMTRLKAHDMASVVNIDYAKGLKTLAQQKSQKDLEDLYQYYCQAKQDLAKQVSLNEQLLFEDWLVCFRSCAGGVPKGMCAAHY